MRLRSCVSVAIGVVAAVGAATLEREARACGGCFHPPPSPTEGTSVVTDHNMILSVSQTQTTLYDQIKYTGSPSSFAWVLPIAGTARIGLSSDVLFQALNESTATSIVAPPRGCPPPPSCGSSSGASAVAPLPTTTAGGGVTVISSAVVGPYLTVTLAATDPNALADWLSTSGFVIPTDVAPVVAQYVNEKFNFLAMKLLPGAGVNQMRPVSVTTTGAAPTLPLRMVAAGTGAVVGITLYVVAEGKYEPQNFPMFHIDDAEIAWDWTQNQSNYKALRKTKTDAGGGKIWELESSVSVNESRIRTQLSSSVSDPVTGKTSPGGYLPVTDGATITKTAEQVRDDDVVTLFAGMTGVSSRVTRLRADLAHASLDKDLVLTASSNQGLASNVRNVTKELDEPLCPVYSGCTVTGQAPRSQVDGTAGKGASSFSCASASRTSYTGVLSIAGLGGYVALVLARRRRRG